MMLYFVAIFWRDAGAEGDKKIPSKLWMFSARLAATGKYICFRYPPKDNRKGTDIL